MSVTCSLTNAYLGLTSNFVLHRASFDHTARVWDADQGTCLYVLDRSIDLVYSVSFSPLDGEFLALGSNDRRMCVYRKVSSYSLSAIFRQIN